MAPPRKGGINTVTRKRPDGSRERHYYDRQTKRYLGTDRAKAEAEMGVAIAPPPPPTVFEGLCAAYLGSTQFRALSPRAQKLNRLYVDHLRDRFGSLPVAAITRPVVVRLREKEAPRPWFATHLLSKLRLVLQHGVDIGVSRANPALRPGGVRPPRRHAVWSRESTVLMMECANADIRLGCALLLYTAQRPSDVLAMTWQQVVERDGRLWLSLRQQKTGELVTVPAHADLAALLRGAERRSVMLVPSPTGKMWSLRNFSRSWDKARARADYRLAKRLLAAGVGKAEIRTRLIKGQQRRDLRRTAMVRMAEAGASTAQIAAVSGHTIDQTSRILDTYIPRRGEVAVGAIEAWERGEVRGVVLHMKNSR